MDVHWLRVITAAAVVATLVGCASATSRSSVPAPSATDQARAAVPSRPSETRRSPSVAPATSVPTSDEFVVTKERYARTFEDVRRLISELNSVIARGDYAAWLAHLTHRYVETYGDPRVLERISREPVLARRHVLLHSLRDYFLEVVMPSRTKARLDDLEFVAGDHVRAIMSVGGKDYILYDLRFEGGRWRIAVS